MNGRFDDELFRFMECVVVELDCNGDIIRMNPFAEDFFERHTDEVEGEAFVGGLVAEKSFEGENQAAEFKKFIRHPDQSGCFEMDVRIPGGSLKRITWTASVYFDPNGEVEKIVCIGVDRRACIQQERERQRGFDLLESFLGVSKVAAFSVNARHRFFYLSPGIEKVIGYNPEELIGRTPGAFLGTDEKSRISGLVNEKIRMEERYFHLVSQIQHKDGTSIWNETGKTLNYSKSGEFEGIVGLSWNVDSQKKAEMLLAEKEKELRFCFEHAQVLLIVTDEEGIIRSINRAGARIYGRQPEEIIGHVFTEFLPDFERMRVFQQFKRDFQKAMAKKGGRTVGMGGSTNKIQTPDGLKDIYFYKSGVKIYKDGEFEGILNTAIDVTEIIKAREELKRHQNHLEHLVAERTAELQGLQEEMIRRERLTALGKMANVISQELRTPLSTISNSIFILNESFREKKVGIERSLERVNRAIRRCYNIVDEFKIFTQTDDIEKCPTEIDAWLNRILDKLSEKKGVPIVRELNSGVTLDINRERIRRAIVNVIENAWQAGQTRNANRIFIRSQLAFNRLEIEIEDRGVGIKRKDLEEVLKPLFSTKSFGLGLGLPTTRQIVEQHGGGISIDSEEKRGTKVLLWLPVDKTVL